MTGSDWVEVVLALPGQCWRRRVALGDGMTVREAVRLSGLADVYRDVVGDDCRSFGVYGRKVAPDQALRGGDRVELYRPLVADPRQRRRARVNARRQRSHSGTR